MLTEWTLANFKAIDKKVNLKLAPLTILVGENSSGKSSILQSILVVSQTLRATSSHQPIVLNGEYTRLGYMSDVVHDGLDHLSLEIGCKLETENLRKNSIEKTKIQLNLSIQAHTPDDQSNREGILSELNLKNLQNPADFIRIERTFPKHTTLLDLDEYPQLNIPVEIKNEILNGMYDYTIKELGVSTGKRPTSIEPFELHSSIDHFLPSKILETYDAVMDSCIVGLEIASEFLRVKEPDNIKDFDPHNRPLLDVANFKTTPGSRMKREIVNALHTNIPQRASSTYGTLRVAGEYLTDNENLFDWLNQLKKEYKGDTRTIGDRLLYRAGLLRSNQNRDPFFEYIGVREVDLPSPLSIIINQLVEYFANQIYYLGPLREDPRFIYALPPYPDVTHVGLKGEFAASVLERYKNKPITYPCPPSKDGGSFKIKKANLLDALLEWLEYMGLLGGVITEGRGKNGTELRVKSIGVKRELDLTSIGVGVSQILPTLVMGLIAPTGTTFLFEQPELHLHPKVQSMVADFLLGLTKVGKQCIVETHSEYLVNRIRRRVAEDETSKLDKETQIYFVERSDGRSSFRALNMNQYGAVLDWPDGFFDEGPNEAELIMRAALKKRKQTKEGGQI